MNMYIRFLLIGSFLLQFFAVDGVQAKCGDQSTAASVANAYVASLNAMRFEDAMDCSTGEFLNDEAIATIMRIAELRLKFPEHSAELAKVAKDHLVYESHMQSPEAYSAYVRKEYGGFDRFLSAPRAEFFFDNPKAFLADFNKVVSKIVKGGTVSVKSPPQPLPSSDPLASLLPDPKVVALAMLQYTSPTGTTDERLLITRVGAKWEIGTARRRDWTQFMIKMGLGEPKVTTAASGKVS